MGNCHKTRLCRCLHNSHCHLPPLLTCYQSFFNFNHQSRSSRGNNTDSSEEEEEEEDRERDDRKKDDSKVIDSNAEPNQSCITTQGVVCNQPRAALVSTDSGAAIFAAPISAIAAVAAAGASRDSSSQFTKNYCDLHQIYSSSKTRTFRHYHHYHPSSIRIPSLPAGSQTTLHSIKSLLSSSSTNETATIKVPINRQRSASHCPKVAQSKNQDPSSSRGAHNNKQALVVASSSRSDVEVPGYKPSGCINSKCYCHQANPAAVGASLLSQKSTTAAAAADLDTSGSAAGQLAELASAASDNSTGTLSSTALTLTQQEQQAKRASSLRTLNKRFGYPTLEARCKPSALATTRQSQNHPPHESLRLCNSESLKLAAMSSSSHSKSGAIDQIYNPNTNYYMPASNHNFRVIDHQLNGSEPKRTGSGKATRGKAKLMKLNDLNNECLLTIISHLTLAERLICERVCRRWQHVVRLSLQAPASLKIGEHSVKCNCTCAHYPSWDLPPSGKFRRDESGYIVYPHAILCYLLTICKNLRCLNFSHCYLDDQTLQIIMTHSDMIECLHLYDIRLEADSSEDIFGMQENNGRPAHAQAEPESLGSAMSAFASEQLAVFGGLMRRFSTRKPPSGVAALVPGGSKCTKQRDRLMSESAIGMVKTKKASQKSSKKASKKDCDSKQSSNVSLTAWETKKKPVPSSLEISSPVHNVMSESNRHVPHTPNSEPAAAVTTIAERKAAQRRREWSRHQSDIRPSDDISTSSVGGELAHEDEPCPGRHANRLLSPNLESLVTDYGHKLRLEAVEQEDEDEERLNGDDESELIEIESAVIDEEYERVIRNRALHYNGAASSSHGPSHSSSRRPEVTSSSNSVSMVAKLNDIQEFVALEQVKTESRQTHLLQWKLFVKKLGGQITSLSIGALNSVDQIVIDTLMKSCEVLEELRISNEIDILSYMTYLKDSVKRIHINCEHGVGVEVVSMLAFRNFAEKVIKLGRISVRPEHIDSVISTIGSNFINLGTLQLHLEEHDIDVATPASLLFSNLRELNLEFGNGNVDRPFKKLLSLGWASVRSLTLQYGSLTEDAVRAIGANMPQLRKLVLHAVEFRCDHQARRYGHRICTNCSHAVWKAIALLSHLNHLRLHRVIIDEEICKALYRMSRLSMLELQFCQNVNDNVVAVCAELAKRNPRKRFSLDILSRNFVNFNQPPLRNFSIELRVVGR